VSPVFAYILRAIQEPNDQIDQFFRRLKAMMGGKPGTNEGTFVHRWSGTWRLCAAPVLACS